VPLQISADICLMLARDSEGAKSPDRAAGFYHEGLKQAEGHVPTMLSLARLYLQTGDMVSMRFPFVWSSLIIFYWAIVIC
jgi:hypothetical protein